MKRPCECQPKHPNRPKKLCCSGVEIDYIEIPVSAGTDAPGQPLAPENGAYKNAVVKYAANNHVFIYTSEGIPVMLSDGGVPANVVFTVNGKTGDVVLTTSDLENTSNYQTAAEVAAAVGVEVAARIEADNDLQSQIDAIAASSDVADIVGTYADLQAYDTSKLKDNDIIKVLQDETHDDETTYYRWSTTTQTFTLIGEEGPYYTKSAADQKFQDKLIAGTNITIDAFTNTISASANAETIFYANLNETGNNRHIYKDIAFTTAVSVQELIDANNEGQVILRGTSIANPTAYSDAYLQNAFIMPHNNDFEFVFLDRDLRYEYSASDTTDTVFFYSTSEIQPKLTAGTNINISGTTISATDTTYSNFTGTDGQTAGTAGLVPAPATTDDGKYLKADGTWASVNAGPTVVQIKGTSTTDVMSQDATTKMAYPDISNAPGVIRIGNDIPTSVTSGISDQVVIGNEAMKYGGQANNVVIIGGAAQGGGINGVAVGMGSDAGGGPDNVAIGATALAGNNSRYSVAIGSGAKTNDGNRKDYAVALGAKAVVTRNGEVNIGTGSSTNGYNSTSYRVLGGVHDPVLAQDAATKNYSDNLVVSYATLNGNTAPTTATEAKYIGQLYYDTTGGDMYYCSAITPQGTTPETYSYTWTQLGGGGGGFDPYDETRSHSDIYIPDGTNYSPNYTSVYISPRSNQPLSMQSRVVNILGKTNNNYNQTTQIGYGADATGNESVAIGEASAGVDGVAIGYSATTVNYGIAIGQLASAMSDQYQVKIGTRAQGSGYGAVGIGAYSTTNGKSYSVALGYYAKPERVGEVNVGTPGYTYGYNSTAYRVIGGVHDPQLAQDAATKNYVDTAISGITVPSVFTTNEWNALWS